MIEVSTHVGSAQSRAMNCLVFEYPEVFQVYMCLLQERCAKNKIIISAA